MHIFSTKKVVKLMEPVHFHLNNKKSKNQSHVVNVLKVLFQGVVVVMLVVVMTMVAGDGSSHYDMCSHPFHSWLCSSASRRPKPAPSAPTPAPSNRRGRVLFPESPTPAPAPAPPPASTPPSPPPPSTTTSAYLPPAGSSTTPGDVKKGRVLFPETAQSHALPLNTVPASPRPRPPPTKPGARYVH